MPFVNCSSFNSSQAAQDAEITALQADVAALTAGGTTPASVLAAVQAMSPAQIATMCAELDCPVSAADLAVALSGLSGAGTAGNVLTSSGGGVYTFAAPSGGGGLTYATVADMLSTSSSTGKVVTDDVFRAAVGTGQNRAIEVDVGAASPAGEFVSSGGLNSTLRGVINGTGGTGIAGVEGFNATTNLGTYAVGGIASAGGNAVGGTVTGAGDGIAGEFVYQGTGNGGGLRVYTVTNNEWGAYVETSTAIAGGGFGSGIGNSATSTGTGVAVYGIAGQYGSHFAAGQFEQVGANTTWGVHTNGAIFTAGGVTTSDSRVKRNITEINLDNAISLQKALTFYTYDKLLDASGIEKMAAERRAKGSAKLKELKASKSAVVAALESAAADAAYTVDTSDKALTLGRQAGVIAQELQGLTHKIGDFQWLVKLSDKNDENSTLVVDYESLDQILNAATAERLKRAGF